MFVRIARAVVIVIAAFAAAKILRRVIDGVARRTVDTLETTNKKESKERVQRVTTLSGIGGKGRHDSHLGNGLNHGAQRGRF